jgi:uncharacterized membrane protein YGL010W
MANKKSSQQWFDEYAESHQNPTNKLIHWICVPIIMLSLLGLVYAIPIRTDLGFVQIRPVHLLLALALVFYFSLSTSIFLGMLIVSLLMYLAVLGLASLDVPLWASSLALFIAAWLGQFYGHRIEGKKPSFLKDLQFLLVGPAWLLHFIYKQLGIAY